MCACTHVLDIHNTQENDTCRPQDNSREWEGWRQEVRASVVHVTISVMSLKGENRETGRSLAKVNIWRLCK